MNVQQMKREALRVATRHTDEASAASVLASDIVAISDSYAHDWKSLATRLAEALREQTPTWRKAGCWCAHPRDTKTEGHAENCNHARDALAAFDSARGAGEKA
jgi:hypothetical protein